MRLKLLFLVLIFCPLLAYGLPAYILVAWSEDLSSTKVAKIEESMAKLGLSTHGSVIFIHTPTGKKWTVSPFHTAQFRGKLTQQKIQAIRDVVASITYFKMAATDNPRELLKSYKLEQDQGSP